jgi:hypothetical protein
MNQRPATVIAALARGFGASLALLLWAPQASATPNFPADVDADLMLKIKIETTFPTLGCRLCHLTESPPATNPPLKPFGELLFQQYGVVPYDDGSLKAALMDVERDHPELIQDIESGLDPNADQSAPPSLPTPEYGCSAGDRPMSTGQVWIAGLFVFVPLVRTTRRARRPG